MQDARRAARGATLVEYALAVTAICLAIAGAANLLTSAGQRELANQADCVSSRPPPPSCQIRAITTTTGVGPPTSPVTTATTASTTTTAAPTTTTTVAPTTTTTTTPPTTTTTRPPTTTTTRPPTTTTTAAPVSVNPTWTASSTENPAGNLWVAEAEVRVRAGSTNVVGAVVTIQVRRTYEGGSTNTYTTTCTTGANGRCQFAESFRENGNDNTQVDAVRFRVVSVSGGAPAVTLGTAPSDLNFSNPA